MALLTGRFRKGKDEEPPAAMSPGQASTGGLFGRPKLPADPAPQEDKGSGGLFGAGGLAGWQEEERRQQETRTVEVASDDSAKEAARNAAQQAANAGARLFAQTQVDTATANQQGSPEVVRSGDEATAAGKRRGRFRTGGNSSPIRI